MQLPMQKKIRKYMKSLSKLRRKEKQLKNEMKRKLMKLLKNYKKKNKKEGEEEKIVDKVGDSDDEDEIQNNNESIKKVAKEQMDTEAKAFLNNYFQKDFKEYKYVLNSLDPFECFKKVIDYDDEKIDDISNGVAVIKKVKNTKNKKKELLKMHYCGVKQLFTQQMRIYATNKLPSILEVIGYRIGKSKQDIFIESKYETSLENYLKHNKLGQVNQLIIAYGIACAMELLHSHNIVHRNLTPAVILLDSCLRPYVSEFYYARQIDTRYKYDLKEITPEFMAPEFIDNYRIHQNSFKIDIFAYGVMLFIIVTGKNPYIDLSASEIVINTKNGERPAFPDNVNKSWISLIQKCWNQDPTKRPSFKEICDFLESDNFAQRSPNYKIYKKYKKLFKRSEVKI